jgi:hypothetical protein
MNMLKLWMRAATPSERRVLAKRVGTSEGNLVQYAGGHRNASAQRGITIELQTKKMHKASKGRLPLVYRTDLVAACRDCHFAQKCLGPIAKRADFQVVTEEMVAESEGGTND